MSPEAWLSKTEAADRLGVSKRTVETWIAERKLSSRPQPQPGKRPTTVVDPADVERLQGAQQRGAVFPVPLELEYAQPEVKAQLGNLIAAAIERANAKPRPFLTLGQAEAASGLPAGLLRRLIRAGKLAAERYADEWYLRSADLDSLQFRAAAPHSEDGAKPAKQLRKLRHRRKNK